MLPLEHSAILLTCIKRQLVLKTNFLSSFGWLLKTGFTVFSSPPTPSSKREIKFVGAAVSTDAYAKVLLIIKQPMVYCTATFVFHFFILFREKDDKAPALLLTHCFYSYESSVPYSGYPLRMHITETN